VVPEGWLPEQVACKGLERERRAEHRSRSPSKPTTTYDTTLECQPRKEVAAAAPPAEDGLMAACSSQAIDYN
tara:strand:- start:2892 stop:3107 length:216 start_codon:yes stop_codon:yes gene_type:complete